MGVRDIPTSARYLRSIVQALQEGYHPSLKGPAGTGKSKLARLGGALLGNVHMDALTPQTDSSRLKGEFKPTLIEVGGEAHLGFQHVPSHLIDALRDRTSTGLITCLLDEAAHGRPDVVEELHTLLDRDGGIWVVSEDGKTIEFLERPENFRLILASNTYGYEGVNLQSQAFRSRTHEIFMDFEYSPAEITALLCAQESASPAEISLGQTLHSARQLFLDHGEPADSVTLREVGRIRNYQEAFLPDAEIVTPEQQAAVAVHAFWLTLGAHLPKEKREGELGQKLQELITKIEIPRVEPTTLATELHQIVQPKPVEFDTSQSITKALVHAAFQGSFVEYLSILNLAQLLRALAPRLSFELLQELCRHENPYTLRSAAEGLVSLSEHLEGEEKQQALDLALSILQKQCEGEDTFNIWPAAVVLGNLSAHLTGNKQALTSVFSALQTLCGNEDPDACRYAAEALGKLSAQLEGEEKQQALGLALSTLKTLCSALSTLKRLSNDEFNVRQKVPETLGRLSAYLTGNKEALDQALFILQKLCEHEHHPAVLQHAAEAWGKLGALHEGDKDTLALALSALQKFCKNESPSVRRYAAEALGRLSAQLEGEEKQQALALGLSTLQTLCRDKNAEICQAAIKTLEKFSVHLEGNKQALAVVLSLLQTLCKDQNFFIHPAAAQALGSLSSYLEGEEKQQALALAFSTLQTLWEDEPWIVCPPLVSLSEHLEGDKKQQALELALSALRTLCGDKSQTVRQLATEGLGSLSKRLEGEENQQRLALALSILRTLCSDNDASIRSSAAKILSDLATKIPEVREKLNNDLLLFVRQYEELKTASTDSVVRISPLKGDSTDLPQNMLVFAETLRKQDSGIQESPQVSIHPDFDPTLVTAHKLTNQTVQALAINRFVLISGDPASGKSEVGRYISDELDWNSHVFNAHRYVSEEEVMQKIGIVANGKTRFTITDGPLADALINGKLFILNEIHRAKAGNLSFLFNILADIDTEFDYYDASTGRTVRRKIHPNFRMIATRNLDGSNMNAALKNRAIEIHADAYSDLELAALIRSKHPELRDEGGSDLADTLVRFYEDLGHRMEAKAIGEHAEGYAWNLRHLMRIAEGFAEDEHSSPQGILQIMWDRVGVSLTPEDRANFFDAVRNFEYAGVTISEADVQAFREQQEQLTLAQVAQELDIDPERLAALCREMGVRDIPTSARYLRSIVQALQEGYHPSLKGPAGTGKSKLARLAGAVVGNVHMDALTPQTDSSRLKGEFKPTLIDVDGEPHLGFQHVPSHLVDALRDRASTGLITCILDEAAHGRPDVVEELHTLLDRDGGIWVVSEDGKTIEFLERPENFRLILASNTYGYEGVNLQSEAFRSRTHEIFMDFEYTAEELDKLLGIQTKPPLSPPSGTLSHKGRGKNASSGFARASSSPTLSQTSVALASPPAMARSFGTARAYTQRIQPIPAHATQPMLQTWGNPVRDKLAQFQGQIPESVIAELERKYAEVESRLLGAAAAMGRTGEIVMEFDPSQETCAMSLEAPRVFLVGANFLLHRTADELILIALHEGGHADISRIGTGFFFQSEVYRALTNIVDDVRVNARVVDRVPGRAEEYKAFLRNYYYEGYQKLPKDEIPELLPHEAFMQAIMSREYGESSPWDNDPLVGPALEEVQDAVQRAKASRPREDNPDEMSVQRHVAQMEGITREEILPAYLRLYRESLQQIEEMLRQAPPPKDGDGTPGGGGRRVPIDPKDLSEEARKILEKRAKSIADQHAPKDLGNRQARARQHFGDDTPDQAPPPPKPGKPPKPGSLEEALGKRHQDYRRQQGDLKRTPYSKLLSDLKSLPEKVFRVFERLLKPNTDFEFEGYFTSGPRPDIERAIKAIHGLLANLKVFKRKTEPTARDWRFSLLVDASQSMDDGGTHERGGMGLAALFVDVFERLNLPYGLDAFHNSYIPLKGFGQRLRNVTEKNNFFNTIQFSYWGLGGTNIRGGIRGALNRIDRARQGDPREQEFLFVLTDGRETHQEGATIRELCEEAAKRGIIVVGIGIGEGMQTVREHFPVHLVEKNPEQLPQLLAEFIKEYVQSTEEGP
jgi:MoxR-like ATPase/HEAT repeat protein